MDMRSGIDLFQKSISGTNFAKSAVLNTFRGSQGVFGKIFAKNFQKITCENFLSVVHCSMLITWQKIGPIGYHSVIPACGCFI